MNNPNPWFILIIGTLGGAIVGWLITRGMQYLSKPDIDIILGGEAYLLRGTADERKFVHVKVLNKKRNRILRFLLGNATASFTRAWVTFIDPVTKAELFEISGRWTTTKEPVDYITNRVDPGLALVASREVIPAGENSEISIATKKANVISAFAFNNESYLHAWEKPDYELTDKRYFVKIRVAAEGYEWTKTFTLLNTGTISSSLRLTNTSKQL